MRPTALLRYRGIIVIFVIPVNFETRALFFLYLPSLAVGRLFVRSAIASLFACQPEAGSRVVRQVGSALEQSKFVYLE